MNSDAPLTYREAGVDIDAQDETLRRVRDDVRSTFIPGVLGDIGSFGGLFDLEAAGAGGHVLVASADGVGTKIAVARQARRYDTVGQDLVNHCVNDILVQGARPLFFMDYLGTGRLEPEVGSALIRGCATACRANGMALLGGETAEMPGTYGAGDFDLVGFVVGAVRRDLLLDGSRVRAGQRLIGLRSSGLHTNGYSLARAVVFERLGWGVDERPAELEGASVADALLAPHRSYLACLQPLVEERRIAAMAHITGGGLTDNLPRVLGEHDAWIDRSTWTPPALFRLLVEAGNVEPAEAFRTFNMGIGMVLLVEPEDAEGVLGALRAAGEDPVELGDVRAGSGEVRWIDA